MQAALALSLAILATPAGAAGFSCSKMSGTTRCSDGSTIERRGKDATVIYKHDASGIFRSTRCDTMLGRTRCR